MIEKRDFYINGAGVAPSKPHDFTVIDPSTEEACATFSLGSQADTDAAVAAAEQPLSGLRVLDLSQAFESDQKSRTFIIIYVDDDFLRPGTANTDEKVLPNPSSALHLKLE